MSFFSQLITTITGRPADGEIIYTLEKSSTPARKGLRAIISKELPITSEIVPGVGFFEGGAPYISMPLGDFPARFRLNYLDNGKRGTLSLDEATLAETIRDFKSQVDVFGYVMHLPNVITTEET
jgi:hypothetical protein